MEKWAERAAKGTAAFIKEIGIYRLGGNDGCPCTNFEVQNIHVDVSCHKSDKTVRVWSRHLDYSDKDYRQDNGAMQIIADEVLRQVDDYYGASGEYAAGFDVRFCSWDADHPNYAGDPQ